MDYLHDGLSLSLAVTPTLVFFSMAIGGMVHGRLKVEPQSPWIVRRDRPFRFAAVVAFDLAAGSVFAAMSMALASRLLR